MRISVLSVLLAALCFSGCINFTKPKPVAGDVEESFKTRWVAKRMSELQANGTASEPRDARKIAIDEFKKKYEYTSIANKPDPVTSATP
jgi:hypothetical protein